MKLIYSILQTSRTSLRIHIHDTPKKSPTLKDAPITQVIQ